MHTVFAATYQPPGNPIADRIKAKVALWSFLAESLQNLQQAYSNKELTTEIIGAVIYTLHPHYSGPELIDEARLVLLSLHINPPHHYPSLFANTFQRIVAAKIKSGLNHKSG